MLKKLKIGLLTLMAAAAVVAVSASSAAAWQVQITPGTTNADTPTSYDIAIAHEVGDRQIRKVEFTLPDGVGMSPTLGSRLATCSDDQFKVSDLDATPTCPADSQIATVSIKILNGPNLPAAAYLGPPTLGNSGDVYPLLIASSYNGQWVKLSGNVVLNRPDLPAGTASSSFALPGIPIESMLFSFRGGDAAALVNPETCGVHTGAVTITDIDDVAHQLSPTVNIAAGYGGGSCSRPFEPTIQLKTTSSQVGKPIELTTSLDRKDGDQHIQGLRVSMPHGVSIDITKVVLCPAADVAKGACPAGSAIGTVTTTVGAGPGALTLTGQVYLTQDGAGPGMTFIFPAKVGPIDLGNVVLPATVDLGSQVAGQLTVDSKLPSHFRGIPLVLKHLDLKINKPGLMTNPKDCGGAGLKATVSSTVGTNSLLQQPYPVVGGKKCQLIQNVKLSSKRFAPSKGKLTAAAKRKKTKRGAKLSFSLRQATDVTQQIQQGPCKKLRGKKTGPGGCKPNRKWKTLATTKSKASAGANSFRFTGLVRGKPLAPGKYRVVLSAVAGTERSSAISSTFTIVR